MGFNHLKVSDVVFMLIVTHQCHFSSAQNPSYFDPSNNYDNYNNDYNFSFENQMNTEEDTSDENDSSEQPANKNSSEQLDWQPKDAALPLKLSSKILSGEVENDAADSCWMELNAATHFMAMDNLDEEFKVFRENYQLNVGEQMDREMLDELLRSRGAAPRTVHKFGGNSLLIPAGLNLGGQCMLRLQDSILFFHRMKLRNSTHFSVNYLHNDLENMALIARIGLNDLHLVGAYERSATHNDPSVLYYRPSYGTLEILLKNVNYKMEARFRMMSDRITIELIKSELVINDDILMSYLNTNTSSTPDYTEKMESRYLDDFIQILKTDLDLWLKDFFNDFLMYYKLPEYDCTQIREYEKKKTLFLNEYVNYAVNTIRQKIYHLGGNGVQLPKFTLFSVPNMILRIKDGVLRGLDTMYRRSVATGAKNDQVRVVDVIVGFSKLKAEYKFEAVLPNGSPPLDGILTMSADELTAHLGISLVKEPESVDLSFDFIQQMKPESLIVEGPANRLIANFKHQLEHNIIALISNALMHNIKMLNTITRCVPFIYGKVDEDPYVASQTSSEESLKSAKKSKTKRRLIGRNKTRRIPQKNRKRLLMKNKIKK